MSQNPPFYHPEGHPSHTSPSQAPPPRHPQQPTPMNVAPAMQAQQTAFQQNAALPANPMEMLASMNISLTPEQFMQLAQMFQSGAIPLAPPAAVPVSNQPPQPQAAQQPQAAVSGPTNDDDADMDKEEGEVEEEEIVDAAPTRGFLKTPPKGPRRRSRSPQPRFGGNRRPSQARVRSPVHPAANGRRSSAFGGADIRAPPANPTPQQNGKHLTVRLDKGAEVKIFIKEMFQAGHSYDAIAKYINHPQQFQRLWDSLGLPRGPAAANFVNHKSATQEVPKAPAKRAPPPKPTAAPQDRSAYLAKLQAAKNKKTEAQAASPAAARPPSGHEKSQAAPATVQQPSNNSTPQPARRAIDSNLVRQRLEALKAAKAKAEAEKKAAEVAANKAEVSTSTSDSDMDMDMSKSEASEPLVNEPKVVDERAATAASGNIVAAGLLEQAQMPQPSARSTYGGPGLPGLFTSDAAIMPSPTLSQPHHGIGSPSFTGPYPNYSKTQTAQRNVGQASKKSFGMGAPSHERVIIIDSDEESDAGEAEYVPTGPFNAFPVRKSKDGESAGPATPLTPNPEAEKMLRELEEAKKRLADKQRKWEEKQKKKAAANATANGSGSEAGTPAGNQTPIQPHQATASPLATRAVEVDNKNDTDEKVLGNGQDAVAEAVPPEPRPANTVSASFQGELEQQVDDPNSFADSAQPYHDNDASQAPPATENREQLNDGDVQETENAQVEPQVAVSGHNAEPPRATAPPLPDDEEGDMDIDDDDLDDIYEQSGPPAQRSQPVTTTTHADYDTEDEDDTGSAMDTSSDDSDDSDDYYEPADGTTGVEAMPSAAPEPMPEPVPVAVPTLKPNKYEQSGEDSTESDADAGDIAASEDDEVDDELAAELQPSEEEPAEPEIQPARTAKYTPYVSPLSRFKDYRYHRDFLATVPGGFKSLTYNHKIDPITIVCPFETSGGKCNDKTCEFQHFDSMALSDNQLLKLMGADQIPAKDPEDVKKWKTGLASLISQIRVQNQAKDVEAISKRIAEYRREFVGDPSKVLLLD